MTAPATSARILVPDALLVVLGTLGTPRAAQPEARQFSEAELYLELNDTDGDLGIHASIDGDVWTDLTIEGPGDRTLFELASRGRLRQQGLTQLFFESAEPTFNELAPERFFRRFPEGEYEVEGRLRNGQEIASAVYLSHVLAAPPAQVTLSGVPAAEDCDAVPLPVIATPVVIDWEPVTDSHPDIGRRGPVAVSRYQVFVERQGLKLSADLLPATTIFEVPAAMTRPGEVFKFEIIVRTTTGNNTAIESCFVVQ